MPNESTAAIGHFVRARRKARKLTQAELAELAQVGIRFVSELERGKASVRLDHVDRVLAIFGKGVGVVELSRDDGSRDEVTQSEAAP